VEHLVEVWGYSQRKLIVSQVLIPSKFVSEGFLFGRHFGLSALAFSLSSYNSDKKKSSDRLPPSRAQSTAHILTLIGLQILASFSNSFSNKLLSNLQDCSTLAIFLAPMAVEILFLFGFINRKTRRKRLQRTAGLAPKKKEKTPKKPF
jgi:hypothetical protein